MLANPELIKIARWKIQTQMHKQAYQPPGGGDPAAAGVDPAAAAAGMDPAAAGGMPPMPPGGGMTAGMDPAAMAAAGSMATGGGDIQSMVTQAVQAAMASSGGGTGGKTAKVDINTVAMDVFQIKKMLVYLFNMQGIPLPPDVLDGPNRNPSTGVPVPPNTPGSTSDPSNSAPPPSGGAGGQGGQSAIPPIAPMQGAFPSDAGGGKTAYDRSGMGEQFDMSDLDQVTRTAAIRALVRKLEGRK